MKNKNEKKSDLAFLILAGKINLPKYNFKLNEYLFNVGNSLALEKILKKLSIDLEKKVFVAITKKNVKFTNFLPFKNVEFIEVGQTISILDSISKAIKKISQKNIAIIPITTIPDISKIEENSCYFGSKEIPKENWSAIKKIDNNNNFRFLFKEDTDSYGLLSNPCTGRILVKKVDLEEALKEVKEDKKSDILSIAKILIQKFKYKIIFEKWFDVGHETTYFDTKLSAITSRFFNNVFYKESTNTILKLSSETEKIKGEYLYYENLPRKLKSFFPFIFSQYNYKDYINSIEMEFIPYPNLAEIFLFKNIGPNAWIRIISSLTNIYKSFYEAENYVLSDCSWLYSNKLLSRFNQTVNYIENSNNNILKKLLNEKICVNKEFYIGNLYSDVKKLRDYLLKYENSIKQYLGHGDLCFNNILVEQISGCVKLIDPKAFLNKKFNNIGYIDPHYDLAKLNHSYKYLYDSVVNNLYSISSENDNLDLNIYAPQEYNLVNKLFDEMLVSQRINSDHLRMITSSLFLSMLPLHVDDEKRMICFAILGSIALNNFELNKIIVKI